MQCHYQGTLTSTLGLILAAWRRKARSRLKGNRLRPLVSLSMQFILALSSAVAAQTDETQQRSGACRLTSAQESEGTAQLSNLKRIRAVFEYNQAEPRLREAELVTELPVGPIPSDRPRVLVRAFSHDDQKWYLVKVSSTGGGQRLQEQSLSLTIEIPIDEAESQRAMEEYLRKGLEWGDREGLPRLPEKYYEGPPIGYLDWIYVQNRVGSFEIHCSLIDNEGNRITAKPLEVEIRFDGSFFDQPGLKIPEKGH